MLETAALWKQRYIRILW